MLDQPSSAIRRCRDVENARKQVGHVLSMLMPWIACFNTTARIATTSNRRKRALCLLEIQELKRPAQRPLALT